MGGARFALFVSSLLVSFPKSLRHMSDTSNWELSLSLSPLRGPRKLETTPDNTPRGASASPNFETKRKNT
jgi:hypothetical protein